MSAYASVTDVESGFRELNTDEKVICTGLLSEASLIVDAYNSEAKLDIKKLVVCRMVRRAIGSGQADAFPLGATQGTVSAMGYSQSWTVSGGGTSGELYITKMEKKLLGAEGKIGSHSPLEDIK